MPHEVTSVDYAPRWPVEDVRSRLAQGRQISAAEHARAWSQRIPWPAELAIAFDRTPVIAWPTLGFLAPLLTEAVPRVHTNIPGAPRFMVG